MNYVIEQIIDLLKQANTLAETLDNFTGSQALLTAKCSDGAQLVIHDTLDIHNDGTSGTGGSSQIIPAKPDIQDLLGQIKKNKWF